MSHIDEAQIVAHLLGDDDVADRQAAADHLRSCAACRGDFDELRRVLDVTAIDAPPRGADYGARVWARLEPRLRSTGRAASLGGLRPWLAAAAVVVLALSAFLVGRWSRQAGAPEAPAVLGVDTRAIRERVVLAALGEHLDRTERALVEIANASAGQQIDISAERAWARDLLEANRLYRQSARGAASPMVVDLLADIEPILLEIVNSPNVLSPDDLQALQSRIDGRSFVFKLRVTGAQVRERQRTLISGGAPTS